MCLVKSRSLVCASSKTYLLAVEEGCLGRVAEWLERAGKVTARYGPLVKGVYKDAIITLLEPDKVQVILQFSKLSIEEIEEEIKKL
ncbi:hypothetical protein [Thermofilum pendens]|uniref:Uncharacterized protein n=1 Tax=Thermofilum pendens (strain DSM 2475 / Hrk 5) TaxID=368408 RepID=A1RZ07_THEPD|nr:hypothetical protein [Thermofilum pendens]ABL78437.1 hypothetical protein Tpen_1037 [Thermofilum pendens Hrk 5]